MRHSNIFSHYSWLLVEYERVIAAEEQVAELAQLEAREEVQKPSIVHTSEEDNIGQVLSIQKFGKRI